MLCAVDRVYTMLMPTHKPQRMVYPDLRVSLSTYTEGRWDVRGHFLHVERGTTVGRDWIKRFILHRQTFLRRRLKASPCTWSYYVPIAATLSSCNITCQDLTDIDTLVNLEVDNQTLRRAQSYLSCAPLMSQGASATK